MTKAITTRQAILIIFIVMVSTKLVALPSIISYNMGANAWFVFAMSFVIDFVFLLLFLSINSKLNMPLLTFVRLRFGKVISTIFAVLVGIMMLFKTIQILVATYLYFSELIYVEINRVIFICSLAVLVYYFGSRYMQSLARSVEIVIFVVAGSLVLSLILSLKSINLENLLPFLNINFYTTTKTMLFHNLWFGDFWLMFFFVGNIQKQKNTNRRIIIGYLISAIVVLVFVAVFTCTFDHIAPIFRVCIIDITEVSPRLLDQARFSWLVNFTFPIALIYAMGIYSNCSVICIKHILGKNAKSKTTISTILLLASIATVAIIFNLIFTNLYYFLIDIYCYFNTAVQYVLPVVLLVLVQKPRGKNLMWRLQYD